MQKNLIITLLFSIVIALFAILNAAIIPVNLIFVTVDISAALVILIAASLGAILVYTLNIAVKMKLKKAAKVAEKKLKELQDGVAGIDRRYMDEIEGLRNEIAILETQLDEKEIGESVQTKEEKPKAEKV